MSDTKFTCPEAGTSNLQSMYASTHRDEKWKFIETIHTLTWFKSTQQYDACHNLIMQLAIAIISDTYLHKCLL